MKIVQIKTNKDKRKYLQFLYSVYKNDSEYCDMNVIFVKTFLYKKDDFTKRNKIIPIMIYDGDKPILESIFVIDESNEIKLSFLEFCKNINYEKCFNKLKTFSRELLIKFDKEKVIIGINGQISYGLGILTGNYNRNFEFNSNYNPSYYTEELDKYFKIKKAFSYEYDVNNSIKFFNKELLDNNYKNFDFRLFNKKHFKEDMIIFGDLCHKSLKQTPYYAKKTAFEMYQLMKQTKLFFKNEDIIFAMKDGKEIGFIYTHPDYAQLFNKGKLNYVLFYLRYLFKKPNRIIYNVIGVLPEYQKSGIAMNLIDKSIQIRKKDFRYGSSSFILEDNKESTNLCRKMSIGINKEFHLYEIARS